METGNRLLFGLFAVAIVTAITTTDGTPAAPSPDGHGVIRQSAGPSPGASTMMDIAYGTADGQTIRFWYARVPFAPVVAVIVHAADRADPVEVERYLAQGYSVALVHHRPHSVGIANDADDIAAAIARLRHDAARLHIDAERIALLAYGDAAGATFRAATDRARFASAGLEVSDVRSVVLVNARFSDSIEPGAPVSRDFLFVVAANGPAASASRALSETIQRHGAASEVILAAGKDDETTAIDRHLLGRFAVAP